MESCIIFMNVYKLTNKPKVACKSFLIAKIEFQKE